MRQFQSYLRVRRCISSVLLCVVGFVLISCSRQETRASLPAAVQGDGAAWRRDASATIAPNAIPLALRRLGAESGTDAVFTQGERRVPVRVYQLGSGTAAFEAVQTYPRAADEYYFQMGTSFVVVQAGALLPAERRPFLVSFQEAAMPGGSPDEEN